MTNAERLNLRARQILDDPTLQPNQKIRGADALFKQLAQQIREGSITRDTVLNEITDGAIRQAMADALAAVNA